jgi:molecular chaperone DnaK
VAWIIGIDLGTTNSCVAVMDGNQPRVLPAADGARTTPSVVAFTEHGNVLVGTAARRQAVTNPRRTIYAAKRLIGRKVNEPEVQRFARTAPFEVVAAPNGDAWIRIDGTTRSPQEIAAHVLRRLRAIAEDALGDAVTRAVVTVPAYFDDHQRQATKHAGTIAGLDVVRILNEPTAAALAYGAHRLGPQRRIIAVFDLGGGTFDISIMAVENGVFEVLATGGDADLGGDDWDRRIVEYLADRVFDQHRVDLTEDPVGLGRLVDAAEQAKQALSSARETRIHLPYLTSGLHPVHLDLPLSRDQLDELTASLLSRLSSPCERALSDARLGPEHIEEVLLVGGMSRMPAVQRLVERLFARPPSKGAHPDEVVALGAATHAGILRGDIDDTALLDVTPHSIGIRVGDGGFAALIPRNSMLPVRARRLFATSHDNQRFVRVEVYQGEESAAEDNRKLGEVVLEDLPEGRAGEVRIELLMTMDVESLLSVSARELRTGREARVCIRPSGGLSDAEVVDIIERRRSELPPASDLGGDDA